MTNSMQFAEEQIRGMSDGQLIWLCAESVMRWRHSDGERREAPGWWTVFDGEETERVTDYSWNPLTDWNHTMEVVDAVLDREEQQEWWMLQRWCNVHRAQFGERNDYVEVEHDPQRAIVIAAILASKEDNS